MVDVRVIPHQHVHTDWGPHGGRVGGSRMLRHVGSRNEPLRLLLHVVVNDEEDKLLSSIVRIRRENISLVQHRSTFFSQ